MSKKIFDGGGGASWQNTNWEDYQYITLAGTAGKELASILMGRAPSNNVSIQDDLDYTLNKSFNGDVLVSTFGHKPVMIQITGFDLYRHDPCVNWTSSRVQNFWASYNVHSNSQARVMLSLNGAGLAVYMCVLTNMRSDFAGATDIPGVGGYGLTLIGVPV